MKSELAGWLAGVRCDTESDSVCYSRDSASRPEPFLGAESLFLRARNADIFFPTDIYLGELMSTVCGVHVRGWAGMGACSAEGGRRPGRTRRRAARGRLAELLIRSRVSQ